MNSNTPPRRKSLRLLAYDYRQPGAYFITICTHEMTNLLGPVVSARVDLNPFGEIAAKEWLKTAEIRENVTLDAYVIMPNHFHGILMIDWTGPDTRIEKRQEATHRVAGTEVARHPRGPAKGSVGSIVGQFKSHTALRINRLRATPGAAVWKPNYYEHIIRSDRSLERIRDYIDGNPARRAEDRYYIEEAVPA